MTNYDAAFFEYVNSGATRSADQVLPLIYDKVSIDSVLDVGCGQGAWLAAWQRLGITSVSGIDGDYVNRDRLLIPQQSFVPHNLVEPFDLGKKFDIVQSLEVAEHLDADNARGFIASLVKHGDLVLFSAAAKGQGGDNHVNEQDYDYWRALFAEHGYVVIDYLRPLIIDNDQIESWYRYNVFIYASPTRFDTLLQEIKDCRVNDDQTLSDLSPPLYRFRKKVVQLLPVSAMTGLAKLKERIVAKARAR